MEMTEFIETAAKIKNSLDVSDDEMSVRPGSYNSFIFTVETGNFRVDITRSHDYFIEWATTLTFYGNICDDQIRSKREKTLDEALAQAVAAIDCYVKYPNLEWQGWCDQTAVESIIRSNGYLRLTDVRKRKESQ